MCWLRKQIPDELLGLVWVLLFIITVSGCECETNKEGAAENVTDHAADTARRSETVVMSDAA